MEKLGIEKFRVSELKNQSYIIGGSGDGPETIATLIKITLGKKGKEKNQHKQKVDN